MTDTPPAPPRIIGDEDSVRQDIVATSQYLNDFYKSTVLEGYFAAQQFVDDSLAALAAGDPVDLSNLPDPLNTNVAAAQTVANAAYTLATQREGGSFSIADPDTSATVTFADAEPDTDYYVVVTASAESGAPAVNAHIVSSITKSTTGFTVNIAAAPGVGTSVTFDYIKIRN